MEIVCCFKNFCNKNEIEIKIMIIVRFKGGLGNQLFQYGLYKSLAKLGKDVRADISDYEEKRDFRKFQLKDIGMEVNYANERDIIRYRGKWNNIIEIILRRYGLRKNYFRENEAVFEKKIFSMDNVYLDGFWQNELYFKAIELEMREEITKLFCQSKNIKKMDLKKQIESVNSVSVHIRRGDYIKEKSIYTNLGESDYYNKAINFIREKEEKPVFFLFSDDTEWIRGKYAGEDVVIVENYKDKSEQEDLILMSKCKHNIIANSSYSWWAAWLNNNNNKIVIAPKEWFTNDKRTNIVCSSWLSI